MREITLFWKTARLTHTDIAPVLKIINDCVFLAYIKRTPRDIQILMKANFKPGKTPEDLNSLFFLELLHVNHAPENDDGDYILKVRISHPLSNFNARTGGTTASPGCKLDAEGLSYIIQGGNMRLRLVASMAKLIAKPDRISARQFDISMFENSGPLNSKQLKLAKYAYSNGWYDFDKQVTISDMAKELKLARATLAEHLSRIESIVMDDFLGSFSDEKIHPDEYLIFKEMIESDAEKDGYENDESFKTLLKNIHINMNNETEPVEDFEGS